MLTCSNSTGHQQPDDCSNSCDVLVVGSGAAGLMAALTARHDGAKVMVLEKEALFGGTSACSGGWLWIPGNHVAKREGVDDSVEQARAYLQHEAGPYFDAGRVDAFLTTGPKMIEFCEAHTQLRFLGAPAFPDGPCCTDPCGNTA